MKPAMELTDEQADAIVRAIPDATPMEDRRAIVKGVWKACAPLFLDAVLEEAAKACERQLATGFCADPEASDWIDACIEDIRAMKGAP